jgi:O-antigen ligase
MIAKLFKSIPRDMEKCAYGFLLAGVFSIAISIAFGQTMLIASFLFLGISLMRARKPLVFPKITWFALVFVVLAIVIYINGIEPEKSIKDVKRLGWFILLIPLSATLLNSRTRLTGFLKAYVFGSVATSLYMFVKHPLKAYRNFQAEKFPTFLDALIDAGSMTKGQILLLGIIACLAFVFIAHENRKQRLLWWALLGIQCVAMILNFKRGSWMCLGGLGLIFVTIRIGWKGMVAAALAIVVMILVPPVQKRLGALKEEWDPWKGGRLTMWTKVMPSIVREHPMGIGYKSMNNDLMQETAKETYMKEHPEKTRKPRRNLVEWERKHFHSNIFQVLVETGWLGLAVYIAWMIYAVVNGVVLTFRSRKDRILMLKAMALLFMLLGLFANGLVEYNFGDTELIIVMSVLMGVMSYRERLGNC